MGLLISKLANFTDHEQEGVTNDTSTAKSDDDDMSDKASNEASDGQTKAQTPNEEQNAETTTEQTPIENIHIGKFREKIIKYLVHIRIFLLLLFYVKSYQVPIS